MTKYIITIEAELPEDEMIGFKEQLSEKIGNIKVLNVIKKEKEVCKMDGTFAGELAYKNGYERGVKEFAEKLKELIRDMRFAAEADYQCEYIDELAEKLAGQRREGEKK